MRNCGNCANYNHERLCHTDVCSKCFIEGANGKSTEPSKWEPLPLTNGDRIRAMSDEELAKAFSDTILCVPEGRCRGNPKTSCYECWLNWLKQPAKED